MNNIAETTLAEIDQHELRLMLQNNDEFFIEYFLADEIPEGQHVEDFHLLTFGRATDLWHNLEDTIFPRRDVIALPREHAKTTYARLGWIKLVYFSNVQFFVYMGSTHGNASTSIQSIWQRIMSDAAITAFGMPRISVERLSQGHIEFWVEAYDEEGQPYEKLVIFKALGVGQALRGMNIHNLRPQYVTCDDIEDDTAVLTKEGYMKIKHWFDNTFMRAVSRQPGRSKVFQIGNLIGMETLLNDNLRDPEWRSLRLGVLRKNGEPLWPAQWPHETIKADLERAKRRGSLSAWFGEMMNMPYNIENALISYEDIFFQPRRHPADERDYATFITVDPAISTRDTADEAAVVLHTIDDFGLPQITEYIAQRGLGPDGIADAVAGMCARWGCRVVGVESVALQRVLINFLELKFATRGIEGVEFVPIEVGQTWKTGRLMTWAAAIKEREYCLSEGDWGVPSQLISFDTRKTNNTDDLIDACSMGMHMMKYFMHLIMSRKAMTVARPRPLVQQASTNT